MRKFCIYLILFIVIFVRFPAHISAASSCGVFLSFSFTPERLAFESALIDTQNDFLRGEELIAHGLVPENVSKEWRSMKIAFEQARSVFNVSEFNYNQVAQKMQNNDNFGQQICAEAEAKQSQLLSDTQKLTSLLLGERDLLTHLIQSPNGSQANYWSAIRLPRDRKLQAPIIIAIIDDGIRFDHPDLSASRWQNLGEIPNNQLDDDQNGFIDDLHGFDFLANDGAVSRTGTHGTRVAGIIAATTKNKSGMTGIAPGVSLMSLVACKAESCSQTAVIRSILYAADNGASIINISLTTFGAAKTSSYNSNYDEAVRYASIRGSLIVAASGNGDMNEHQGQNLDIYPQSPVCNDGAVDGVLGVGALDTLLRPATFSNFGAKCVDIYAPGSQINTTDINGYAIYDGTSFATPIVSGVAALIRSAHPELKPQEVISHLKKTSWEGVLDAQTALDFFSNNTKPKVQTVSFTSESFAN